MSPWTALLESLHSALIDDLNERLPDLKPELGMPLKQRELAMPNSELKTALICAVSFTLENSTVSHGFAALGADPAYTSKIGLTTEQIWEALIHRAEGEFLLRNIKPRFGTPSSLSAPAKLPYGFAVPGRVVWIPFRLNPGTCYLGIGA